MSKHIYPMVPVSALLGFGGTVRAQPYPVVDQITNKDRAEITEFDGPAVVVEKGPATFTEKTGSRAQFLHGDPQMRASFIGKLAAPIGNKMFECSMIP